MSLIRLTRRNLVSGLAATAMSGTASFGLSLASSRGHEDDREHLSLVPSASSSWISRVRQLHERLDQGDFTGAAESAGYLTDEAFTRADGVVQAWLNMRDLHRGFLPRVIGGGSGRIWNYKDCAADIFCHFVIEASLIAPKHLGALRDILAEERALIDGLPQSIDLDSGEPLDETRDQRIFGAVEYAKDGLLAILERIGPTEWLDRMHEIVDAIIVASPIETRYGRLPSESSEKNGEFLQVLARLYHRERRPEHLAAGRAIADAYTQEILPSGRGLPAHTWNFTARRPRVRYLKLRDHGNEIVSGLSEWMIVEDVAPDSRRAEYSREIERMMNALLDRGRDAAGLWGDVIRFADKPVPPQPPAQPTNDTWGYLTAGYVAYALSLPADSECSRRYLFEAMQAFAAAIRYRRAAWQKGQMDGYADTIEGALYLLPFLNVYGATRWIDDEMGTLMSYQKSDGLVGNTYLDGNFVRTALLYALFRTQGTRLDPWQPGLRLGAIKLAAGLRVVISSDAHWNGRIIFDRIRHREHLKLPYEYPRLNGWSEWFTVDPGSHYEITHNTGDQPETKMVQGKDLTDGIAVNVPGKLVIQVAVHQN